MTVAEQLLYRIPEAAALLGISRTELYALVTSGKIESVKLGARRRIPRGALLTFVEQLRREAGSEERLD